MAGNIYQSLVQQGLQLWNGGDKTQAMDYFQASLKIQRITPEAMFYVAVCIRKMEILKMPMPCLIRSLENMETLSTPEGSNGKRVLKCVKFSGWENRGQ